VHSQRWITGDCIALKTLVSLLTAGILLAGSNPLMADEKMSAVQLAAAAKLIGKLGNLRGSVKPEDKSIFVTLDMVAPRSGTKPAPEFTGGVPKTAPKNLDNSDKTKLPPIVLEMGPDIDRLLEKIMSGTQSQQAKTKTEKVKPFNLQNAMTLAHSENSPMRKKEIREYRKRAINSLEEYFTPPARSK